MMPSFFSIASSVSTHAFSFLHTLAQSSTTTESSSDTSAGALDRFMGLSRLRLLDPDTYLGWRWPMPAWLWVLVMLAAAAAAWWSYRHLLGAGWARFALGVLRAVTIIVIIALLVGPMLILPREHVEPDWLIMLVDRSASMQIRDMKQPDGSRKSRDEVLRDTLRRRSALFGDQQLGKDKHILWLGFDGSTYTQDGPESLSDAAGQSTALRTAIEQAMQRAAGHPVSALIVISDGRTTQDTAGVLVHELQQQAVGVIAVPMGSAEGALDFAVAQVQAPDKAFIDDPVPVSVWVERYPADVSLLPGQLKVKLIDAVTGEVLDEKEPTLEALSRPILLTGKSSRSGPTRWRAQVIYEAGAAATQEPAELITENNHRDLEIELVDRQLKVLYVEGYPRWDYRYLKNMLLREKSVLSSVLLRSADRGFVQEGTAPIKQFPRNAQELAPYDVIIIGDVPSGYFGSQQLQMIQDHVATTGAGILWIGGPRDMPVSYEGTPLSALLPMLKPGSVLRLPENAGPVRMMPAALAQSLQVLELDDTTAGADKSVWEKTLSPLWWVQDVGQLKPTAEVLAMAQLSSDQTGHDQLPAVLRIRFGAGQALYVATDDTWRWRFGRDELYFERFWTQMIRMLARGRLAQDDARVSLNVSSRRASFDEPVVVTAVIKDPLMMRSSMTGLKVEVSLADDAQAQVLDTLELQARPVAEDRRSNNSDAGINSGGQVYEATWRPRIAGRLTLRLAGAPVAGLDVTRVMEVVRPDDELRQPAPDIARLETLAKDTGGHVLKLEDLRDLTTLAPNRARRTPDDIREPLWNSSLALLIVILLLTVEWIGRKLIKLT